MEISTLYILSNWLHKAESTCEVSSSLAHQATPTTL